MRRKIALSLFMTLLLSVIVTPLAGTQAYAADNAKQIIDTIGIMETDKGSNEVTAQIVTRARFAQMLVNASTLKDSVSGKSNVTLFSDVKKKYWASGYIQTAIIQGWMSGYLNGTFKPDRGITLQEAVYSIIKLLGYTNSDFSGSLSDGIMKLYKTKGLNDNISRTPSQYLTVKDCYYLFYNTLKATTKMGCIYAVSLGYTVDSSGVPNYLSLVSAKLEGPIIVDDDWKNELPFSTLQATFYKDGVQCRLSDISDYDVLYYSKSLKSVWVYDNKVTGTVEAISPDYSAPQSVTVSSKTYSFADSDTALKFSSMGEVKEGDLVTLVLDKDNAVADVYSVDELSTSATGVVIETGYHMSEQKGQYVYTGYVVFVDAAGNKYQQDYDKNTIYFEKGNIARLTYSDGTATVSKVTQDNESLDNLSFNSDGSRLGSMSLASNVKILDLDGTKYISIYPERLAGVSLLSSSVYYYETNENGEISQLILGGVTGDTDQYGIYTGISFQGNSTVYTYLIGATSGSLSTNALSNLLIEKGPAGFVFTDNTLTKSYALIEASVSSIGTTTIQSGNLKMPLADNYYVYLYLNNQYVITTLAKVADLSKYSLSAYYDNPISGGGRVRVIVAQVK